MAGAPTTAARRSGRGGNAIRSRDAAAAYVPVESAVGGDVTTALGEPACGEPLMTSRGVLMRLAPLPGDRPADPARGPYGPRADGRSTEPTRWDHPIMTHRLPPSTRPAGRSERGERRADA